ncbi:hypothetical protein [Parageobacillus thermoglucosidasius]|uniref:hypothetical protein n=1 Tax=Parageobacillus thermoglucosidasius TaxID=1426 RepID=UPI0027F42FA0|nr:hypothetical protein PthstB1num2_18970 [Parageobacillus thermoglucosidasius]
MKEEILLVKIHNTLAEGKDHYEATRGNWRMSKHRFPYIQYVAGWDIMEKSFVSFSLKSGRLFKKDLIRGTGTEASSELLKKLQMVEDKIMRKFGSRNAIAYLSLEELDQLVNNCQAAKYSKHHATK